MSDMKIAESNLPAGSIPGFEVSSQDMTSVDSKQKQKQLLKS